ncbi:MAG: Uma2 family endonuclease [Bacteroidota bacterium]
MEQLQTTHRLTLEEYNQLEEENQQRYEYHDGEVYAMAGGDPVHNAIGHNIQVLLGSALRKKSCNVFTSDQKVYIQSVNRSFYPDASVTCGSVERSDQDTRAITNPILLMEVLSDSTEAFDRGEKFEYFSKLSSLQEYVLVSQHEPVVQVFYRDSENSLWQMNWVRGKEKVLTLRSLEIETTLEDIYLKTEGL